MIAVKDLLLFAHAGFGVLGCLAAVWVFVEVLNANPANALRIHRVSLLVAASMMAAWICGGYWYLRFYPAEKTIILSGSWRFGHNIFMETKEHLFFATAILALLLPIATATREKLFANPPARKMALTIAALVVITGMAVETAGAVIDHAVKVALLHE